MTPASFTAWRIRQYGPRGITAAADALGCSRTSIRAWEAGGVTANGKQATVPRYIALACQALANGLPPMA